MEAFSATQTWAEESRRAKQWRIQTEVKGSSPPPSSQVCLWCPGLGRWDSSPPSQQAAATFLDEQMEPMRGETPGSALPTPPQKTKRCCCQTIFINNDSS